MAGDDTATQTLHSRLADQLGDVFEGAANTQRSYYAQNPDKRPSASEVDHIISKYAYQNAAIAGGASLIPGPWGLVAVVPELVWVVRNQVKMIYDIGVAYGQEAVLTRELLLAITLSASGAGTLGLLVMHGSKVLVKRKALRAFQKLITLLAGKITQKVLKSAIAKWLPLVGAMAIAAWTKWSTAEVGKKAKEILSRTIEVDDDESDDEVEQASPSGESIGALVQKVHALANLMKVDGEIKELELTYLTTIIENAEFDGETAELLYASLRTSDPHAVDLEPFRQDEDEALALVIDMVALANRDGEFHPAEKRYLRQVADELGLASETFDALTA